MALDIDLAVTKLVVFDFDGVMTDNRVLVDEQGREYVFVNRSDGMGIRMIKSLDIPCMILSTELNPVVSRRAEKLNIPVLQGIEDKRKALYDYCISKNIPMKHVLYVGNDINDLEVMNAVGIKVAPKDAYPEVREISDIVLETPGGYGVVRELAGMLYKVWQKGDKRVAT